MNFKKLIISFKNASRGVAYVFRNELIVGIVIVLLAWYLKVRRSEFLLLLLLIFSVLVLEILNSAVEKFVDILKPRLSFQIELVKDIMAAVVLITTVGAILLGIIIFWPYLFALFLV